MQTFEEVYVPEIKKCHFYEHLEDLFIMFGAIFSSTFSDRILIRNRGNRNASDSKE